MVEQRRLPLKAVVAVGAGRDLASIGELCAMDVLMTLLALGRGRFEVGLHQLSSKVRGLVAIDTGSPAMRSQQGERRLGVIESAKIMPRLGIVAGLTAGRSSRRARQQHAVFELAFVGIGVANRARAIVKAKYHGVFQVLIMRCGGWIAFKRRPWLMTISAGSRQMPAGQ